MRNVYQHCVNLMVSNNTTILFILSVQENCRAHQVLQNWIKIFLVCYRIN